MPALLVGRLWAPGARRDGSADRSAIRAGRDEPAGFGKLPHSTIAGSRAGPILYCPATRPVFRSEYGAVPKRRIHRLREKVRPVDAIGSGPVEQVEIHDLVPRGYEVAYELLLTVLARVHLRDCAQHGVGRESEVDATGDPLDLAGAP